MRECTHRSGDEAHQFHLPGNPINEGTSRARTIVASRMTPAAVPMPSSLMKTIYEVAKAPMPQPSSQPRILAAP